MPLRIQKVEDIGRLKIVRADFAGQTVSIVVKEDAEIPADPHVVFQPQGINIYAKFLACRAGGLIPWKRPGTTKPGSWSCPRC